MKELSNSKRIAKNTLFLYFRMLLLMLVSLYTSRVVLDKLGIIDFGIYNVVGGIVAMLGFLNSAMANAVQRYLSFEIGKGVENRVNHIFNIALFAHFCIASIVFILMEVFGVWYLNTYMNIPLERLSAANWVLQCSILITLFSIIQVPYNAIIIAKEQMGIYAYISILEAFLKLAVVYLLYIGNFDKLKLYSVLMMLVTIVTLLLYRTYCIKKYSEAKFRWVRDYKTLKEISVFASWNMFGELAWVFTGQGVNIILNLFFGPSVNAARGLSDQVNGAVYRFINNFQTAVNPQLVKDFAKEHLDEMKRLLYRSTRFSYYLMLMLSLPLIFDMDILLQIWLKNVPKYATEFCQLILICSLVSTISNLFSQVARAYGEIRKYQICVSLFLFLNFPLSYFFLSIGASPLSTMTVNIVIQFLLILVRLYFAKKMISLSIFDFVKKVLFPIIRVTLISIMFPLACISFIENENLMYLSIFIVSLFFTAITVWIVGLEASEKVFARDLIFSAFQRFRSKIRK